ncbi:hypothetical protein BH11BAC3_BH11BAC3_15870 [soil metagenome]
MSLQLLPAKQAIRYFFIDNVMVEEILHVNKNATKNFRLLDEDHNFLWETMQITPQFFLIENIAFFQNSESLPIFHAPDIHTPPPNLFYI